ncbi:hypothetical protein [Flavisolibacter ginsenosidimutans]|uniref:Uncharacterized protein n=1 Tax=Flavisolibacter ginsenosidimutans TaxID=661481 RepID=A0A5B8UQF5_9BACT|nr:hypothetical protein [Flavisolibacter ginsenosidimutans]QEC58165.1 hypothetical protein FSB75_20390 [Flavisolibacter ginsenosidimutans]
MKPLKQIWLRLSFFFFAFTVSFALWAQDQTDGNSTSGSSSTTKTTNIHVSGDSSTTWYTQPWVWVIGAAIFILLLVALLSGNKNRDTVTTERTTVRDTRP